VTKVLVWITEGTWQATIDAARAAAPADADITLLNVITDELPEAAHSAYLGLFGRTPHDRDPGERVAEAAADAAAGLLDAAANRLARPCEKIEEQGHPERIVVSAAARSDLLIVARDGDMARLGPKSLGKAARFVVDHAPCPVLLVWPVPAPDVGTIPPKPPKPPVRP
jgi:nucleotide-binding universal stress UspA family protein